MNLNVFADADKLQAAIRPRNGSRLNVQVLDDFLREMENFHNEGARSYCQGCGKKFDASELNSSGHCYQCEANTHEEGV